MMEGNQIHRFVARSCADPRIGRAHLAVYLALYHLWVDRGCPDNFYAYSSEVMPLAKISSTTTYHRLVLDLRDFGYIGYTGSYYKRKPSRFEMIYC